MSRKNLYQSFITGATTVPQLRRLLGCLVVSGDLAADLLLATKLAARLSDLGAAGLALCLLPSLPSPDLFLHNVLLRGLARNALPAHALSLYLRLAAAGDPSLRPDNFTYAFAVSAASAGGGSPIPGRLLHAHSVVSGFQDDAFIGSALVGFYLNISEVDDATKVFDGMSERDTVSWNAFVSGLVKGCNFVPAMQVFQRMVFSGARCNSTTLAAVLPAAAELQELDMGRMVHCLGTKVGLCNHSFVVTGLISVYSKCGKIGDAMAVFGLIDDPDLVAWNSMVSGCAFVGEIEASLDLFQRLQIYGLRPSSSTLVGLIPVSSFSKHTHLALLLHGFSIKAAFDANPLVATALVTTYARLNEMDLARRLFDEMPVKNLASWNAMISGYSQNGLSELAIDLFQQMQKCDVRPNAVTITSTLSACAQFGALGVGKSIHDLVIEGQVEPNVYIFTALIDMYAKCGKLEEARRIFDEMPEKNIISWNAIISGYGVHGHGRESLKLFDNMLSCKVEATGVTFLSLLYACSHAGLIDEGRKLFQSMTLDHGIQPGPEHYACMVDLLGRAGELEQALEFIGKMPIEPTAVIWGALLAARTKHKNTSLARLVADNLFKLASQSAGYDVLLSNIYSSDRDYQEAAKVRRLALKRNVAKMPGYCSVEVGKSLEIHRM